MAYAPTFAKPPCVTEFSGEQQYIDFLLEHHVPYWEWGEEDRSNAWKEVIEGDAVYSVGTAFGSLIPVRCIGVIAGLVMMHHPDHGWLVLVEFKLNKKTGFYHPRGNNLSEKMLLDPTTGMPVETPAQTMIRCLRQETGIIVPHEEITDESMQFLPQSNNILGISRKGQRPRIPGFGIGAEYVEEDFSTSEGKFPQLLSFRQVAKYKILLDPRHYRAAGHQDPQTQYFSKWRSVHAKEVLNPIPANEIKGKRAVA